MKPPEQGGNVAVKLASSSKIPDLLERADALLERLDGRRDGAMGSAAVWTIPVSAGFEAMEATMDQVARIVPQSSWWYGRDRRI